MRARAASISRELDHSSTSVPIPIRRARATARSAAARSSTASPSELNTVSSPALQPSRHHPRQHLAELAADVVLARDRALLDRQQVLAGLVAQRLSAVAEQRARRDRVDVELASARHARADRVDVRSRAEPVAPQHRLARARGGDHDVGAANRVLGRPPSPARGRRRPRRARSRAPRSGEYTRTSVELAHRRAARRDGPCPARRRRGSRAPSRPRARAPGSRPRSPRRCGPR